MSSKTNRAIFLDRDGIINVDHGYVYKIEEYEFAEGIFETLLTLQEKNFILIIITNQSGIARGYYSETAYQILTRHILKKFKEKGITITGVYHCPHGPDEGCKCRKPASGMLEEAQKTFDISMEESWMIGDKESDMLAAKNAGVNKRILVSQYLDSDEASYCVKRVDEIVGLID